MTRLLIVNQKLNKRTPSHKKLQNKKKKNNNNKNHKTTEMMLKKKQKKNQGTHKNWKIFLEYSKWYSKECSKI